MGRNERAGDGEDTMPKNNWINTTLLTIIIGMIAWFTNKGFDKMDLLNTNSIEMKSDLGNVKAQMADFKSRLDQMVTKGEFSLELKKRDEAISELRTENDGLKQEVQSLRQHTVRIQ